MHRWTFIQRTVPNIGHLLEPLETAIRESLIPAIVGRHVSELEREIIALPVRFGGLGIPNPSIAAQTEYNASKCVTENLTRLIRNQERSLDNYDETHVKVCQTRLDKEKEDVFNARLRFIMDRADPNTVRSLQLISEKGSGAWLTALPVQSLGYVLNKQEFRDAIRLRYGWQIPNIPMFCVCGSRNDLDHTLTCKRGGHIIFRHNKIRDMNAELLAKVCHNVQVEHFGLWTLGTTSKDHV